MARLLGLDECECVDNMCCDCWKEGCGCDGCFGILADGLETVNPLLEYVADCIWVCGSPIAFPLIFLFPPPPESNPPGGGWQVSMLKSPLVKPLQCILFTVCCPCGQWYLRRRALGGDMTKYKLWQGYHDGPHCLARRCPGAPITIQSGTYGEDKCPDAFLCAEVWCLGCWWSTCCAFDVTRRLMKDERNLGDDPTEVRVNKCIGFFSELAHHLCMCGMCLHCASCLLGCCAPDSSGAQECSDEGGRAASACISCAHTCWRGIWSVKVIAMGCMSAQMDKEVDDGQRLASKPVYPQEPMDRGDSNDEDAWWRKK